MKTISLKMLVLSLCLLLAGWKTFAAVDTAYMCSGANIKFTLPSSTSYDTATWYIGGTAVTASTAGIILENGGLTLKISGATAAQFTTPDSATALANLITVEVSKTGEGCSSEADSYVVQVLPHIAVNIANPADTFCSQTPTSATLTASATSITGLYSGVTVDSFAWQHDDGSGTYAPVSSGFVNSAYQSVLTYTSPANTNINKYKVTAAYRLPAGETLIGNCTSDAEKDVMAWPVPSAPTINGTVSGW